MRVRLCALAALLFAATFPSATQATPQHSATPTIRLTVNVDLGVGLWESWTLQCGPTAGNHPNRAAACKALLANGRKFLAPVPADAMCNMMYGGADRARVTGTWKGARVNAAFSRVDGCQIARWERARALFNVPGTSVLRGNVSLSPTCAVQQQGMSCDDPSTAAIVTLRRGSTTVQTKAVAGKGFAVRLRPGIWQATADAGMRCELLDLTAPTTMPVTIACDTGIR